MSSTSAFKTGKGSQYPSRSAATRRKPMSRDRSSKEIITSIRALSRTSRVQVVAGKKMIARCYVREIVGKCELFLFRVYVAKAFRGLGFGSQVMKTALRRFGSRPIRLRVGTSGPLSVEDLFSWYRRLGFKRSCQSKTMIRRAGLTRR